MRNYRANHDSLVKNEHPVERQTPLVALFMSHSGRNAYLERHLADRTAPQSTELVPDGAEKPNPALVARSNRVSSEHNPAQFGTPNHGSACGCTCATLAQRAGIGYYRCY